MENNDMPLSELSTKEEVANYFHNSLHLNDEVKNIFLNEYISGDVLAELTAHDLNELNIRLGPRQRILAFIHKYASKFKEKKITEKITSNSSVGEIRNFFEKYLEFKGELNNLDGKGLLELTEERMKELGLRFGQRKRLIKYIRYFKELELADKEDKVLINEKSSSEEVSKFLRLKLNFSQDSIDNLALDGESLFDLIEEDINDVTEITKKEKENLKKFIRGELDINKK